MINDLEKLLPILKYVDETIFERQYGRIVQLMRLPLHTESINALLNFQDPNYNYKCFTFRDIHITPILEEYDMILDFSNNSHQIYFKQIFKNTTLEVVRLLCLGKVSQCRVADGGFRMKAIEARMKKNDEEGKLGNERYKLVAFAIFGLVLFPCENEDISLSYKCIYGI